MARGVNEQAKTTTANAIPLQRPHRTELPFCLDLATLQQYFRHNSYTYFYA